MAWQCHFWISGFWVSGFSMSRLSSSHVLHAVVVSSLLLFQICCVRLENLASLLSRMLSVPTALASLAMTVFRPVRFLTWARLLGSGDWVGFVRMDWSSLFPLPLSGLAQPNRSLASVLRSHVFCQLRKFESCAIIFSRARAGLAPVGAAGVHEGSPTRRAPDVWESARF